MRTETALDPRFAILRDSIKHILQRPFDHQWTLQGLGMLRTYLGGEETRLHVWSTEDVTENVAPIHSHAWDFTSVIVAGILRNQRYTPCWFPQGDEYFKVLVKCGPGGGALSVPEPIRLWEDRYESYTTGESYSQTADELHQSIPCDGVVSIIHRKFGPDRDHATVCMKDGPFVSAEARPATYHEVKRITARALEEWF